MDWQDVGHAVAKSAPALGAALGGPAGAAVGGLIAAAFGVDRSAAAVAEAVANDPEAAVKLREVELRNVEVLAELMTQRYLGEMADTQHARTTHRDSQMPAILTVALFLMVVGLIAALMYQPTPESNSEVIYLVTGQIIGAFATAIAYWLGSSRGSAEKQRALEARSWAARNSRWHAASARTGTASTSTRPGVSRRTNVLAPVTDLSRWNVRKTLAF